MHTYRKTNGGWETGYVSREGYAGSVKEVWNVLETFDSKHRAAHYAAVMNGGDVSLDTVRHLLREALS